MGVPSKMPENVAAEERAARLARQLSTAEQITHIGSWEWDLGTDAVSWSDELYRIYGLEPGSSPVTRESFLSWVLPDDRPRVGAAISAALERPGGFTFDERIVRPDGSVRLLQSHGETRTDSSGRVVGLVGTCRDVTEERERDEGLRVQQDIVKNLPIGLNIWQPSPAEPGVLRLVAFNPCAEAYGMRAETLGRTVEECFPAPGGTDLTALFLEVARTGEPRSRDLVRYGEARIQEGVFSLQVFPLPGGRVGAAVRDIGEQVRAQEALQRAEATYRHLVESAQAIVWRGDPRTFHFTFVSHEAEVLLGYPVSRWLEEPRFWAEHLHPEDRDWALSFSARASQEGRDHQFEFRMIAEGGRVVWLRAMVRVLVLGGEVKEHVGVMIDVTERRQAEEELRKSREQLRDLSAHVEWAREEERTAIAREIHDELGQAVTALKMDLAFLGRRLSEGSDRPALSEKIRDMSALADETIKRVRRIAKELRPGVLDDLGLEAAVEWQAQEFEARTGTSCGFHSTLGSERLDRNVSTAFFRVLQEALTNVSRHAQARAVEVTLGIHDGRLALEVADDGRGLAEDALGGGHSLGLLGMRERARRLGGELSIRSAPGQGTAVTLSVPIEAVQAAAGQ